MAKIKIIWKDDSVSYAFGNGNYTSSINSAKEYKTVLIAARSARKLQREYSYIKDVRIIDKGKEYALY